MGPNFYARVINTIIFCTTSFTPSFLHFNDANAIIFTRMQQVALKFRISYFVMLRKLVDSLFILHTRP
jgi:hypothetical protein